MIPVDVDACSRPVAVRRLLSLPTVMLRAMPQVGGSVLVNFLGATEAATVDRIEDEGRRLRVTTPDGESLWFALNGATATFTAEGHQTGARLSFTADA
jgi:hypothetical protein